MTIGLIATNHHELKAILSLNDACCFDFFMPEKCNFNNKIVVILLSDLIDFFDSILPDFFSSDFRKSFLVRSLVIDSDINPSFFLLNSLEMFFDNLNQIQINSIKKTIASLNRISFNQIDLFI